MKKKFVSMVMVLAMLLSMMPFSAMKAYAEVEGDWTYTLYDEGTTAAITGYNGTDTEIVIPAMMAGKPVTRIGSNTFKDNTEITSVTIPDSVLRIESGAFQNSMVNTIDLGDGLTYIGQNAFNGSKLVNVTIPNSVTQIDNYSFAMNRNLSSLTINGNNLLTLGDGAFSTTGLSTIRIPTSLSTIEDWTFSDTYLSSLTIPANITSIGYFAFGNNADLNSALFEGDAPTMANFVFSIPSSGFTVYYYSGAIGFTTPTWVAGYATLNTIELDTPSTDVCQIGSVEYESLSDALAAAVDGDKISLLKNIEYTDFIYIKDKDLTLDLNGFDLNLNNTNGDGLWVDNGSWNLTGEGEFNVTAKYYAVYAYNGGSATVTTATSTGDDGWSAAVASGSNSTITVLGDSLAEGIRGKAVYSTNSANIVVWGDAIATGYEGQAVHANDGSVTIHGDVLNSGNNTYFNIYATNGGNILIKGNAEATGSGSSYGVYSDGENSSIEVLGNVIGTAIGVYCRSSASVLIRGNVTATAGDGIVIETSGDVNILGYVFATGGAGASVSIGTATIEGSITASPYLVLYGKTKTINDITEPTTKLGYRTYNHYDSTDGNSTVWVAAELPFATNVAINGSVIVGETLTGEYSFNGTTEGSTTYKWLADSGVESSLFSTMNIAGVNNNPTVPAKFILTETTLISSIENYHWNHGSGAVPGTIKLQEDGGTIYGPWDAVGVADNRYWLIQPYVELPAGTYTILDSSNETWANNSESGYRGMTTVYTKNFSNEFSPIDEATEQTYLLTSDDLGKMIKFEVIVSNSSGLIGTPVRSSSVGPITKPVAPEPVAGTIQFEASGYGTYEGYNGWIRVERIVGSDGIVSVDYSTADDTAKAGIHYTPVSGTLTWNNGDSESKVIPITIANDSQYNGYLYLTYTLSNPTGGAELGSQNPLTVQLSDNDNPPTPTGFTASASNGKVFLEWNEVNSAYYKLYYSTTPGSFTDENSVDIYDGTSYTKTELTNGTTYYFAVKAGHNIYYSVLTDTISATPKAPSSGGGSSYTPPTILIITEENNDSTTNSTEIPSSTASGTVSANVTTAIVDALLDKIDSDGGSKKNDLIELAIDTKPGSNELKISILQNDMQKIIEETDAHLGVTSPFISIIFDAKALETISDAESGGTVVISAGIVNNSSLSESDQAKVKDRPVYDLTVMNGATKVYEFNGGHATVTIPYTLQPGENPNAVVVYYLADDGTLKTVRGRYDSVLKSVVFKTTHFSNFIIGYNPVGFADIGEDAWYKNVVGFIAARGITSGIGENKFGPENKLTRAQFLVLLMNAYQINTQNQGETNQIKNFTDSGNTYYTEYLLAAKSLGIVSGVGNNMFAPEKEITRQEMFVMLYNALKVINEIPMATINKELSNFSDEVQVADWANEALSNLVKAGIVGGSNNYLNPTSNTTRAEIAQVLYNLLSK